MILATECISLVPGDNDLASPIGDNEPERFGVNVLHLLFAVKEKGLESKALIR